MFAQLIILFAVVSCGESDEIKSGKINACLLKCANDELKQDPSNLDLQAKVKEFQEFVDINRQSAKDKNAFDEAVAEHLKTDCKCE